MKVTEVTYQLDGQAPKTCSYCEEEQSFLMLKPVAMAYKGNLLISHQMSEGAKPWICLECFSIEVDAAGHSIDLYEYEEGEE